MSLAAAAVVARLRDAVAAMPAGLREHVLRVEQESLRLARRHGVEPERARLAALGHDLVRARPPQALLDLARETGVEADAIERRAPVLIHGPIAARLLASEYGIEDADVLAAVASHTTARPGMSRLEKVLFLADKIEEGKVERRPEWAEVSRLAASDLDAALLRFLDLQVVHAVAQGWSIHPRTIAARNELLAEGGGTGTA